MTYPRSHLVDPEGGVYHVCSRCVRRAFLCGDDTLTGYNFDHRRQWIEDRLLHLADIFAVDIYGYAVMSNHYHIVLSVNPNVVSSWSDSDTVERWLKLMRKSVNVAANQAQRDAILEDPERVMLLRQRLGSLSWFMRYLNEPLARLANQEDQCTGRFWEGRFKSQRLLDEEAVLACMVYVDLNPVRAGLTKDPIECKHTSLAKRLQSSPQTLELPMAPIGNPERSLPFDHTLTSYLQLVNWTLDIQQSKRPTKLLGIPAADMWVKHYLPKPGCWQRALGSVQSMKDYAEELGQCWIKTRSKAYLL